MSAGFTTIGSQSKSVASTPLAAVNFFMSSAAASGPLGCGGGGGLGCRSPSAARPVAATSAMATVGQANGCMEFIQTGNTDGFQAGKFITLDCSADLNEAGERRG